MLGDLLRTLREGFEPKGAGYGLDAPLRASMLRGYWALGGALLALVGLEFATGLGMAMTYAPGVQSAWASTHFLEHSLRWGHLVRALHYWGAQALIVLGWLSLVLLAALGAWSRPRQLHWWWGLALFGLLFGAAHTGALLPWDQRAYWIVRVEAEIVGNAPGGQSLRRALLGGSAPATPTLTRTYAAHVAMLPLLLVGWAVVRRRLFAAQGPLDLAEDEKESPKRFFPDAVLGHAVLALLSLGVVYALARSHGAPLDAPADPSGQYPARPEWYILGLYRLRHAVEGRHEVLALIVAQGLFGLLLVVPPLVEGPARKRTMAARALALVALLSAGVYTALAVRTDLRDANLQRGLAAAEREAQRAHQLASRGVPPEGPLEMMRNDPAVRPGELYAQHCGSCHAAPGTALRDAHGARTSARGPALEGFGSRAWVTALLNNPDHEDLFGRTELHEMPPQSARLGDTMRAVVEYLYAQGVEQGDEPANAELRTQGEDVYRHRCTSCHQGAGDATETPAEERTAPDLTGWGSRAYLERQITHPEAPSNYGANNHMPGFAEELRGRELAWVVDYVRALRSRPAPAVPPAPPRRRASEGEGQ